MIGDDPGGLALELATPARHAAVRPIARDCSAKGVDDRDGWVRDSSDDHPPRRRAGALRGGPDVELAPLDLLLRPAEVLELLRGLLLRGPDGPDGLLDAYLCTIGLQQLAEDHACAPGAMARQLPPGLASRAVSSVDRAATTLAATTRRRRRAARALAELTRASVELAGNVLCGSSLPSPALRDRLIVATGSLEASVAWNGADLLRPPSSFRSFDQRPEDAAELARRVSEQLERELDAPLTVVGVRTSGAYLAPLVAAELERLGHGEVRVASLRPGWPPSALLRASLASDPRRRGFAVLVDDPPTTGSTLARAAGELRRLQPRRSIVVAVALFPGTRAAIEQRLPGIPLVALEWEDWDLHRLLGPAGVAKALGELLGGQASVRRIEPAPAALSRTGAPRGHVRADYRVEVHDASGVSHERTLRVEGIGLGLFARQALAPLRLAPALFAPVLGAGDGLLLRFLAPAETGGATDGGATDGGATDGGAASPSAVASHLAERRRVLPAESDRSQALAGRQPVWEVAGRLLGRGLGPLAPLHGVLVDPIVRGHSVADRPSLIDGDLTWDGFVAGAAGSPALRTGLGEGPSGHHDLACYDSLFDLAALAVPDPGRREAADAAPALLEAWARCTGETAAPERWLVYLLVQCWNAERLGRIGPRQAASAQATAVRRYLCQRFLDDLAPPSGPRWCALDLDGVLETSPLGFPCSTRAGMLALRALRAHGHPVVLVTGRSLPDLERRCGDYGAAGGVAEYGSVAYHHRSHRMLELVPPAGAGAGTGWLARLDGLARSSGDLEVDGEYRYVVRVALRGARRGAGGLTPRRAGDLLARAGAALVSRPDQREAPAPLAVEGEEQTDFVPAGVDKGTGLAALLSLVPPAERPSGIGLAVGDAPGDAAFLHLAEQRFAPANADHMLDRAVVRTRRAYQAGLAEAVGRFLGHPPGSCPLCRAPELGRAAEDLVALLSLQEAGLAPATLAAFGLARRSFAALAAERRRR